MNQTSQLLRALKKYLKAKGITYLQLADELQLSEASVKRLFSQGSFTLKRIEKICNLVDVSLLEVAKMAVEEDDENRPTILSLPQEESLAKNPRLFTYFYLLLTEKKPSYIEQEYDFSEREINNMTIELERLDLVDSFAGRLKVLTSRNIIWRKGGPIRKKYERQIRTEFLDGAFSRASDRTRLETAELSEASLRILSKKIDNLFQDLNEFMKIDATLPKDEKHNAGLLVAMRPWTFSLLESLRRHEHRSDPS